MRYLNKIVFINSSSLPYSEVSLGGNIHFVGSNGFGKTTLLRAILFFYHPTSEKRELGIKENQQSFSEYYFEEFGSYMIYEIHTETNNVCLFLYKKGGRLQFRFIDAPYEKDFFIKDRKAKSLENIFADLEAREISFTDEIRRYADVRNIIYGATEKREYQKYGLFHGKTSIKRQKLTTIPKAIANIFRSSSLNSDYIKRAIIEAIAEENVRPIELEVISRQISKFENTRRDLLNFEKYKPKAEELISQHDEFISTKSKLENVAIQLGQEVKSASSKAIVFKADLEKAQQALNGIEDSLHEKQDYFDQQKTLINQKIGVPKNHLKTIKSLRKKYAEIIRSEGVFSIESILEEHQNETLLKDQLSHHQSIKETLMAEVKEVEQRFSEEESSLRQKRSAYQQEIENEKINLKSSFIDRLEELKEKQQEKIQELQSEYEKDRDSVEQHIEEKREKLQALNEEKAQITHKDFSSERFDLISKEIQKLDAQLKDIEQNILLFRKEAEGLKALNESQLKALKAQFESNSEKIDLQISQKKNAKESLEAKIKKYEGSLWEFLNENVEDWKQNIGKLIKEEILLQKDLSPTFNNKEEGFFGLKLDLSSLNSSEIQFTDYSNLLEEAEKELIALHEEKLKLQSDFQSEHDLLQQEYQQKYKKLVKDYEENLPYEKTRAERKKKEFILDLEQLEKESSSLKESALEEINSKISVSQRELSEQKEKKNELKQKFENDRISSQDQYNLLSTEILQQQNSAILTLDSQKEKYEADIISRLQSLELRKKEALSEKGVDTKQLQKEEEAINSILQKLNFIDGTKGIVSEYKVNKEQYFDKEEAFKVETQELESQLKAILDRFEDEKTQLNAQRAQFKAEVQTLQNESRNLETQLNEFDRFKSEEMSPYFSLIKFIEEAHETVIGHGETVSELLSTVRGEFARKGEIQAKFTKEVLSYTSKFQKANEMKFPILTGQDDERAIFFFVDKTLRGFIENDLIENVQEQVEKQHSGLISNITREVGDISKVNKSIHETVKQLNDHFEQTNFVGVVKSVKLQFKEKTSGLTGLLMKAKELDSKFNFGDQASFFKEKADSVTNKKSIQLLNDLNAEIQQTNSKYIKIDDFFELQFRVAENNNDTGWVEKLSNVGSEGTDVLVKSMIYITLLNVFKENVFKNNDDYRVHCMIDEVGKLSDRYLRELIDFTNHKNVRLIFGSPNENDPLIYHHVYKLDRNTKTNKVNVIKLVGEA
ncbi:ATP-binding protein [Sediminitomix flava]|uniref:DNA repair exonuclease SbcCD ATPase subunit n=1 Tax=Sediminitomix flava TaxID=379075 RepID=A0A315ZBX4_SEDFL|nr:ATP-binding protein [Sediminitomix flava]PWJ42214.1 DNA repair exonuclease SbcCD ATPase subunit [Sediminitomix flava]